VHRVRARYGRRRRGGELRSLRAGHHRRERGDGGVCRVRGRDLCRRRRRDVLSGVRCRDVLRRGHGVVLAVRELRRRSAVHGGRLQRGPRLHAHARARLLAGCRNGCGSFTTAASGGRWARRRARRGGLHESRGRSRSLEAERQRRRAHTGGGRRRRGRARAGSHGRVRGGAGRWRECGLARVRGRDARGRPAPTQKRHADRRLRKSGLTSCPERIREAT
jgi:hypothetical protein